MLPADNTTAPSAPTPAPEKPKKVGFFAKLFGKKEAAAPVVPEKHESQTPPPQLDDAQGLSTTSETAAPSGPGEELPPTVDVPPAVQGAPAPQNEVVPPTLPTEPPVGPTPPAQQ